MTLEYESKMFLGYLKSHHNTMWSYTDIKAYSEQLSQCI